MGHKDVAITLDRYSHAMPTMQSEVMGRLDALLGRSAVDASDDASAEEPEEPALWLDDEAGAAADGPQSRDTGSSKGSSARIQLEKKPDPSSRSGRIRRIWYRIPDSNR